MICNRRRIVISNARRPFSWFCHGQLWLTPITSKIAYQITSERNKTNKQWVFQLIRSNIVIAANETADTHATLANTHACLWECTTLLKHADSSHHVYTVTTQISRDKRVAKRSCYVTISVSEEDILVIVCHFHALCWWPGLPLRFHITR